MIIPQGVTQEQIDLASWDLKDQDKRRYVEPVVLPPNVTATIICNLVTCKANGFGLHLVHPIKETDKFAFVDPFHLVRSKKIPDNAGRRMIHTGTLKSCTVCGKALTTKDPDSEMCKTCMDRTLSHEFSSGAFEDEDQDDYDYRISLGYRTNQFFNSDCACSLCWSWRDDNGIEGGRSVRNYDGDRIEASSIDHWNDASVMVNCSQCGKPEDHYLHAK